MSSGPGRFGEENRKRREAYIQHNGLVVGLFKYYSAVAATHPVLTMIIASLVAFIVALWLGVITL